VARIPRREYRPLGKIASTWPAPFSSSTTSRAFVRSFEVMQMLEFTPQRRIYASQLTGRESLNPPLLRQEADDSALPDYSTEKTGETMRVPLVLHGSRASMWPDVLEKSCGETLTLQNSHSRHGQVDNSISTQCEKVCIHTPDSRCLKVITVRPSTSWIATILSRSYFAHSFARQWYEKGPTQFCKPPWRTKRMRPPGPVMHVGGGGHNSPTPGLVSQGRQAKTAPRTWAQAIGKKQAQPLFVAP